MPPKTEVAPPKTAALSPKIAAIPPKIEAMPPKIEAARPKTGAAQPRMGRDLLEALLDVGRREGGHARGEARAEGLRKRGEQSSECEDERVSSEWWDGGGARGVTREERHARRA
eukprot:2757286-Rhodomonas_salina.1